MRAAAVPPVFWLSFGGVAPWRSVLPRFWGCVGSRRAVLPHWVGVARGRVARRARAGVHEISLRGRAVWYRVGVVRLLRGLDSGLRAWRVNAASVASHRAVRRGSLVRFASCALLASCVACGGEATDTVTHVSAGGSSSGAATGAPSTGGAASGGAGAGGTANGGAPAGGGAASGGRSTGGTGGTSSDVWYYWCYDWDELKNEPLPGKMGTLACPSFSELDLVEPESPYCYVEADPPEPAVPTGPEPPSGDCCYGITYLHCR